MSVYVDQIRLPVTLGVPRCFREGACHLWADRVDELHDFARRLGLRRGWFQPHDRLPHYDLTPRRRQAAITAGAFEASAKDWIRRLRAEASA